MNRPAPAGLVTLWPQGGCGPTMAEPETPAFSSTERRRTHGSNLARSRRTRAMAVARTRGSHLVADRAVHARHHAHHHRLGDAVPAPRAGAPGAGPAPGRGALLPPVALGRHRHGDQGVGGHPPQAPRQVRDAGRPAQPRHARHRQGAARGGRALSRRKQGARDDRQVQPRRARRLGGTQPVQPLHLAGRGPDAGAEPGAVRRGRPGGVGGADGLDPGHGGRHHQRPGPPQRLPQLRVARRQHQCLALGHRDRRRRTAQQPPHVPHLGQVLGQAVRVRHRLGLHPHPAVAGPGAAEEGAAQAGPGFRACHRRQQDARGHHRQPL